MKLINIKVPLIRLIVFWSFFFGASFLRAIFLNRKIKQFHEKNLLAGICFFLLLSTFENSYIYVCNIRKNSIYLGIHFHLHFTSIVSEKHFGVTKNNSLGRKLHIYIWQRFCQKS